MKFAKQSMDYETPADADILEAYINKNSFYNRSNARKIRRELRKLKIGC